MAGDADVGDERRVRRARRLLCGLEQVEVGVVCQKQEVFGEAVQA